MVSCNDVRYTKGLLSTAARYSSPREFTNLILYSSYLLDCMVNTNLFITCYIIFELISLIYPHYFPFTSKDVYVFCTGFMKIHVNWVVALGIAAEITTFYKKFGFWMLLVSAFLLFAWWVKLISQINYYIRKVGLKLEHTSPFRLGHVSLFNFFLFIARFILLHFFYWLC